MNLGRQEKYTIENLHDWKGSRPVILWWSRTSIKTCLQLPLSKELKEEQPNKTFES
jgi:hypothetical protein